MKTLSSSSCVVCLLLVEASLLLAVASAVTVTPSETKTTTATTAAAALPDEEFLARLCDQQRGPMRRRLPWSQQLHARRHGGVGGERRVPMPPPSRDGEEIDVRYGVSKRVVPSGARTRCTTRSID
ncbi:hypothetical protein E2562_002971 [Oryza meyeriana var. granulata]|uniref:Uncharacterized protein n=1 Tax=Oryza meyeriana var. granulata TaxID=110450 RepID=A0A6G1DEA1_9ORYZ|nr:hypothetical protein E2562_002971 [Oryza meyeriana var. granulata]